MTDEQNQQDPQPAAQEAPATSGEPTQSPSAPTQLQAPSGFEASGYAPGVAASGSSATFAAIAQESGRTNDAPAVAPVGESDSASNADGKSPTGLGLSSSTTQSKESSSGVTSLSSSSDASLTGSDVAPAVAEPGEVGSQPATGPSGPIVGSATPNQADVQGYGVQAIGINEVPESGEDVASLVGSQSASGTSSSASRASPGAATLEEGASDVKSAIARLRDHLWTFEHSAVRHLHAELDKIESWFK